MIPNQMKTGLMLRMDTQELIYVMHEFSCGRRKMTPTQVKAAQTLLAMATRIALHQPPVAPAVTLEELA